MINVGVTIEDADKNEGKFRRKIEGQLKARAKRSAQLWKIFEQTCRENGRKPEEVLSSYVTRVIKYDDLAEDLLSREPSVRDLVEDEVRIGAVEKVLELIDSLGLEEEREEDVFSRLIREELESSVKSPVDELTEQISGESGGGEPETSIEEEPERGEEKEVEHIRMSADKFEKLAELDRKGKLDELLEKVEEEVGEEEAEEEEKVSEKSADELLEETDEVLAATEVSKVSSKPEEDESPSPGLEERAEEVEELEEEE